MRSANGVPATDDWLLVLLVLSCGILGSQRQNSHLWALYTVFSLPVELSEACSALQPLSLQTVEWSVALFTPIAFETLVSSQFSLFLSLATELVGIS